MYLFPKLISIKQKIASIPKIIEFEKQNKLMIDLCPLEFYKRWKSEVLRARINTDFKPIFA